MILEELRAMMQARPFQPFSIFSAGGQEIAVPHHDFAWVLQSGAQIHVEQRSGRIDIINIPQITRLNYQPPSEPADPQGATRP